MLEAAAQTLVADQIDIKLIHDLHPDPSYPLLPAAHRPRLGGELFWDVARVKRVDQNIRVNEGQHGCWPRRATGGAARAEIPGDRT